MRFRFGLATLLNLTVLVCFLLWIGRLDGGAELLAGIGFWAFAALALVALTYIASVLYGIPGDRQRKRAAQQSDSDVKHD
jgi:hypothetical protein